MNVKAHPVRGILSEFVDSLYFISGTEIGTGVAFPRMHQTIIINLGAAFWAEDVYRPGVRLRAASDGIWINGKQDFPFMLENGGETAMYAIGLKLGMVPYFAGLPASETNNLSVEAEDWAQGARLRRSEIAGLRERLMECSVTQGFVLIERYLLSLVRRQDLSQLEKVKWMGREMVHQPVGELCRVMGVTRKRLRNEAQYYFGGAVKNIQGIIRLNRTLERIARVSVGQQETTLSSLHEYFDQAHFIHDFKARTGITPLQYRRLCQQYPAIGVTPNFLPMKRETFLQFISE